MDTCMNAWINKCSLYIKMSQTRSRYALDEMEALQEDAPNELGVPTTGEALLDNWLKS